MSLTASFTRKAPLFRDAHIIARLGGPLLANNLAIAGMAFADTVMSGRLGAAALGAVAVGSSYYSLWLFVALGVLMGVAPSVAHAWGAGRTESVANYFRQALWLAGGLAVLLAAGLAQAPWILELIGIAPEIRADASRYCLAIAWGMPGLTLFFALRFMSEGIGWTRPVMYVACLGLVTNVIGNWMFMYGRLGAPALGAPGCGVASAIVMWVMASAMLLYVMRHRIYRSLALFSRFERPDVRRIRELLGIGAPIAGSIVSEGGLFATAALMIGTLGATVVAAHQIAINYASFMFMVPLALHSATTIHVGHRLGAGQPAQARRAGGVGIGMCAGVMAVSALAILVFNDGIAALYTNDPAVRELAASLLLLAAVFQVSDGLQVGAAGALRGYKDTRVPMLLNLVSYWLIGFPIAWWLGVAEERGPTGVWVGLVVGLTVSAVLLNVRFRAIAARALRVHGRRELDRPARIRSAGRRTNHEPRAACELREDP